MRRRLALNGNWDWYIPNGRKQKMTVPSSYLCVGEATFERSFELEGSIDKCVFLCFDGVANEGKVCVNNQEVGEMLPFVPYRFDVSSLLKDGTNLIKVVIRDITASYGPNKGWENYGGIIRDAYVELTNPVYIEDYQWITNLINDYEESNCILNMRLNNTVHSSIEYTIGVNLSYKGMRIHSEQLVTCLDNGISQTQMQFSVKKPLLWSPDEANLYKLEIEVRDGTAIVDSEGQMVGFKEFKAEGTRFYLNGKETFLKGINRHDMWGDQGFTLTVEQMKEDMRLIKEMGANYVRLVHYPNHRMLVEIADQVGLMVSEEPGLWWDNLNDPGKTEPALEVMKRTVLRDRNNASVIFWLLLNECKLTVDFLSRGKSLCKSLDPTRMVSCGNFSTLEDTKEIFCAAGMDFYSYHFYGFYPEKDLSLPDNSMEKTLSLLNDKPIIIDEWGAGIMSDNPGLIEVFRDAWVKYANNRHPEPNFAGIAYWQWSDIYMPRRGLPYSIDGVHWGGMVGLNRNKNPFYYGMKRIFNDIDHPEGQNKTRMEIVDCILAAGNESNYIPVDISIQLNSGGQKQAWETAINKVNEKKIVWDATVKVKSWMTGPVLREALEFIGGVPVKLNSGRPIILTEETPRVEFKVGVRAAKLYLFGHVTFFHGYPVLGNLGDEVAKYTLIYDHGAQRVIELKNGIDFAASSMHYLTSRINPIASNVNRVLKLTVDLEWEVYQVNCQVIETDADRILEKIIFERIDPSSATSQIQGSGGFIQEPAEDGSYKPLLYGITVLKA